MSRAVRWSSRVALVTLLTFTMGLLSMPARASGWNPPPPVPSDVCGTKQDRFYIPIPAEDDTTYYYNGQIAAHGTWKFTNGTSTVNIIAKTWKGEPDKVFPMTFGVEANSTCTEKADTVTTQIVSCNTRTNGTRVKFTYTNTDDSTNWYHTEPRIWAERWDNGQFAEVVPTYDKIMDGQQAFITGGDSLSGTSLDDFFLSPGTYRLSLATKEKNRWNLPNTLFVPACGDYKPPRGDPMGGPMVPKATISKCNRYDRVRVVLDNRLPSKRTQYQLVVDPRRGRTKTTTYFVAGGVKKTIVLKEMRTGTVIKVKFADKVVKRYLRC